MLAGLANRPSLLAQGAFDAPLLAFDPLLLAIGAPLLSDVVVTPAFSAAASSLGAFSPTAAVGASRMVSFAATGFAANRTASIGISPAFRALASAATTVGVRVTSAPSTVGIILPSATSAVGIAWPP